MTEANTTYKPWGKYTSLFQHNAGNVDPEYPYNLTQAKMICVKQGEALSLQKHQKRCEHWIIVRGTAKITLDNKQAKYGVNSHVYIPQGKIHRLENVGSDPLILIEVQLGSSISEDDIVRLDDKYGRKK